MLRDNLLSYKGRFLKAVIGFSISIQATYRNDVFHGNSCNSGNDTTVVS